MTHTIVDLAGPNSAIDSKKLQFAIDLLSLARPNSPIASAIDPRPIAFLPLFMGAMSLSMHRIPHEHLAV